MRLADFILANTESILAEWEAFARTLLPAAAGMNSLALRNHAEGILRAVALDLRSPQTAHEQSEKSKGRAPAAPFGTPETAAQTHAVLRARSGFDVIQLVAEYRAMRASVLRLWTDAAPVDAVTDFDDMLRFNEAIDQAVAESVGHYHAQLERSRNLLLGMIGHDMRSPLATILLTAEQLRTLDAGDAVSSAAERLIRSGASIRSLLDDLVDFNRTKLGVGINIAPADVDLADVADAELEQLRAANPGCRIELRAEGDLRGRWDGRRVQQLLRNLVGNAIRHGSHDRPIRVTLRGNAADVRLEVANHGPTIDPAARGEIFDPLRQGPDARPADAPDAHAHASAADAHAHAADAHAHAADAHAAAAGAADAHARREGLGLGLFIVREIARAHGGDVDVRSREGETTFAVRLPRKQ